MNYDVVVIGGGPAGCMTAKLIATKGYKVMVAEEHRQIGEPVQCSGLVSPRTLEAADISCDMAINRIHGAFVHSPGTEVLRFRGRTAYALVIDRTEFDRILSERAQNKGAEILTGVKAVISGFMQKGVCIKLNYGNRNTSVFTRLLVGADGVNSCVARRIGLYGTTEKVRMYAAEVELGCQESDMVHIFLGNDIAPGWFGWIIPVDKKYARVGIGVTGREKRPLYFFKRMVEANQQQFKGMRIIRSTGGIVPIGPLPRIYGERTLLVGDAANQTKPLSGGGLYLGLIGSRLCAEVASKALELKMFSSKLLSEYQTLWEDEIAGEIQKAIDYRKVFVSLSDEEMDKFICFIKYPFWQNIISRYGDIDYISCLAGKLSFARPLTEKFLMAGFKRILSS